MRKNSRNLGGMAIKPEDFDFISNFSTLWAVFLGAVLATAGGLAGSQLERIMERSQRQRDAALLFGEILSTLKLIIDMAVETRSIGDPYGPITLRMLRAARRELDIYDRNREMLYSLQDPLLRARIHRDAVRLTMPLDGIFDSTREIETIAAQLKTPNLPAEDREELQRRLEAIRQNRDGGFDFIKDTAAELMAVIKDLEPYAHQRFDRLANAVQNS
jgi:hypothetical protein